MRRNGKWTAVRSLVRRSYHRVTGHGYRNFVIVTRLLCRHCPIVDHEPRYTGACEPTTGPVLRETNIQRAKPLTKHGHVAGEISGRISVYPKKMGRGGFVSYQPREISPTLDHEYELCFYGTLKPVPIRRNVAIRI